MSSLENIEVRPIYGSSPLIVLRFLWFFKNILRCSHSTSFTGLYMVWEQKFLKNETSLQ
jgi:hypothetical protein